MKGEEEKEDDSSVRFCRRREKSWREVGGARSGGREDARWRRRRVKMREMMIITRYFP